MSDSDVCIIYPNPAWILHEACFSAFPSNTFNIHDCASKKTTTTRVLKQQNKVEDLNSGQGGDDGGIVKTHDLVLFIQWKTNPAGVPLKRCFRSRPGTGRRAGRRWTTACSLCSLRPWRRSTPGRRPDCRARWGGITLTAVVRLVGNVDAYSLWRRKKKRS